MGGDKKTSNDYLPKKTAIENEEMDIYWKNESRDGLFLE